MVTAMVSRQVLMTFSAFALGIASFAVSAQPAVKKCTSEECACEKALKQNTVEALEDFLRKYPQSVNNKNSACAAMAVPPDGEGAGPEGESHDDSSAPDEPVLRPSEG